ncbi:T-kininogen 1 isoform X2 [Bombina bombina]|uniref:T-kininogen 1 isoform X2 n=1 Tax=Bombina bombina TaxID=8345 RepID=UPI00235AB77F|nr:T-kininogen 1 isoform X2 [Bombina bombina]
MFINLLYISQSTQLTMRLLVILLLGSQCLLVAANQALTLQGDCNDFNVFDAADTALIQFNKQKQYGNQLVLHRITDARIRPEGDEGVHYFLNYQVREGSCAVNSGKLWQQCDFSLSAVDPVDCFAHVFVNKESNLRNVHTQNCKLIVEPPVIVEHQPCLGCHRPIDKNSEEVAKLIKSAIHKVNSLGSRPYHFNLENIHNATRQVVNGWNYRIHFTIKQTNCSKSLYENVSSEECQLIQEGESGSCISNIFVTPDGNIKDLNPGCNSMTGFCLDCLGEVETTDPELLNLMRQVIDEYNHNSNNTRLYKVSLIDKATKQGKNEILFQVNFQLKETNCSKPAYSILGDECGILDGVLLVCKVSINVTNKEIDISSRPVCNIQNQRMFVIRGLSPFRTTNPNIRLPRHSQLPEKSKGHGHGPIHKPEKNNGKKDKKEKKEKKKKDKKNKHHKNGESSEESNEVTVIPPVHKTTDKSKTTTQTAAPTTSPVHDFVETTYQFIENTSTLSLFPQIPAVPGEEDNFLNLHENVLDDLPEPTVTTAPNCPGSFWIPKRLLPIFPVFPPLTDEDLLLGADDLPTPADPVIEPKEPKILSTVQAFSDDDLSF